MASKGLEGVDRLMRKLERLSPAVRKAAGQAVFFEAEELAAEMRRLAPHDDTPDGGEHIRDRIYTEEGRLGDVSMVVIADAKDAKGRPKVAAVELGHVDAESGQHVPPEPFFWTTARVRRKRGVRRIKSAITRAIRKEAKGK